MNKYFYKLNGILCKDKEARENLENVYTKSEVDNKLNDYVTSSSLSTTLSDYATNSSLSNYYTKSEIDTKLSDYKLKSDYIELTGEISLTDGVGSLTRNYPTGFSASNCVPVAMALKVANTYSFGYPASSYVLNVKLYDNNIGFNVSPLITVSGSASYDYKIILMKV